MLTSTFVHEPEVDHDQETALWMAGASTWDLFLDGAGKDVVKGARRTRLARTIERSQAALGRRNVTFFSRRLDETDHWRLYREFNDRVAYVDIETTGLSRTYHDITVVSLYDGTELRQFVRGKNLQQFRAAISDYSLIVTFNGKGFDLPFLRAHFGEGLRLPPTHLDMRWIFQGLGYTGGLKAIEGDLGVRRPAHLKEADGRDAVRLWYRHLGGDQSALDRLLEYAKYDVVTLAPVARKACTLLARAVGMPRVAMPS